MRKFTKTGLWIALQDPATFIMSNGISALDAALDEFIAEIQTYCREEKDIAERTRTLRYAHSQLVAYKERHPHYESEKKRGYPN